MRANLFISNFNKKSLEQLLIMALFAALLVATGVFIGNCYETASAKNKINAWSKQRFGEFYEMKINTLDMVFMGSSHSYCTFDPENIDGPLGISSYQLGMPLQLPDGTYYTLLELLNTQRPKTVVMEMYWEVLNKDFELRHADGLFQVLNNPELKEDYIRNVFPQSEKVKYRIKPIRFQQDFIAFQNKALLDYLDAEYGLKRTIKQNVGEEFYRSKGYIYCDYVMDQEDYDKIAGSAEFDASKWKMSDVQKKYIDKIAALCETENMELIFVTAPVSNVSFSKIKNYEFIHNQIQSLASESGASYLDFNLVNREESLFNDEHFRDGGHLNDSGVKIADDYFVKWYKRK